VLEGMEIKEESWKYRKQKKRALRILDSGDIPGAYASIASDTPGHAANPRGMQLMMGGFLSTDYKMRKFIEGFN
jgi:hypothetical protein